MAITIALKFDALGMKIDSERVCVDFPYLMRASQVNIKCNIMGDGDEKRTLISSLAECVCRNATRIETFLGESLESQMSTAEPVCVDNARHPIMGSGFFPPPGPKTQYTFMLSHMSMRHDEVFERKVFESIDGNISMRRLANALGDLGTSQPVIVASHIEVHGRFLSSPNEESKFELMLRFGTQVAQLAKMTSYLYGLQSISLDGLLYCAVHSEVSLDGEEWVSVDDSSSRLKKPGLHYRAIRMIKKEFTGTLKSCDLPLLFMSEFGAGALTVTKNNHTRRSGGPYAYFVITSVEGQCAVVLEKQSLVAQIERRIAVAGQVNVVLCALVPVGYAWPFS